MAFANGQYILIHRDAYTQAGGHEAVRDKFVEDIYLARRVKAVGLSSRTAIAHGIGSTRMYTSLPQIIRGWSRILYDALGRNPWLLAGRRSTPCCSASPRTSRWSWRWSCSSSGRPPGRSPGSCSA